MKRTTATLLAAAGTLLALAAVAPADTRLGTPYDDQLTGTPGPDQIYAEAGNDAIFGLGANDYLEGGPGGDAVAGGEGDDLAIGGTGNDVVALGGGADVAYAGSGADEVTGGLGRDTIFGQVGDDRLSGGPGNDLIYAGTGLDRVEGGPGNDFVAADAYAVVDTGAGRDRILLRPGEPGSEGGPPIVGQAMPAFPVVAGSGRDIIDARDGAVNRIDCGQGGDKVFAEPGDILLGCERRASRRRRTR